MKAAQLEMGVGRQEEEGRSQKKCFYKYEILPNSYLEKVNYPHSTWESFGFRTLLSTVNS